MTDIQNLSETELKNLIDKAAGALKTKQANKRKQIIAKIKELAASIDVGVEIIESSGSKASKSAKLPPKYRHPQDPEKTWTGRGIKPKWVKELIDHGHDLASLKV
jgi:DNA-binding protein H-NS